MGRYDGPYEPLEQRLGSRAAFEAHQKSEAQRAEKVRARQRAAQRQALQMIGGTLLVILAFIAAAYVFAPNP